MIFDVIERSLQQRNRVIPVKELLGNCNGSRMPAVIATRLTPAIGQRLAEICPTRAFTLGESGAQPYLQLNYGQCVGCGRCIEEGNGAVEIANHLEGCGGQKSDLVRRWDFSRGIETTLPVPEPPAAASLVYELLGRALNVRQLDPGSCNGCEAEISTLTNPYYDLERFGIHFVASPKHADMLLVTGPVTRNMADAVKATYEAVPAPKLVVAVGACGCSAGVFAGSYAVCGGVDSLIPVDGYIPGCPPTPAMLVTGILEVLRRHTGRQD
jgi:Ni,Fe-hydrogenase III small subunit